MRVRFLNFSHLRQWFEPRKPRHPLVRLGFGLLGLAILALLVFVGVFVGAAMILGGVAWKLLGKPGKRTAAANAGTIVEGEYRVVSKPVLPLSR
ncbi:hypothetical protein [[Pseudomonas] boreopolis]|uniref:Uncharacterized protein n=1 Tax=Xanthomonas boreopolis TaxID=86183 RepID=A0A919FAK7_9XANT|nr:hypothetical protein GCM10009090_32510 [[Pseudomonas] boreopolis]